MNKQELEKIEKYNLAIKKDEENKLLFAYDLRNNEIQEHTEGILKEVNQEIADLIQQRFDINLSDYGLKVVDSDQEILTIPN